MLDPSLISTKYNALLAPERKYDAVVLSGDTWDQLTDFSKSRLRDMVQEGMGLVCLGPAPHKPGESWLDPVANILVQPGAGIPDAGVLLPCVPELAESAAAEAGGWRRRWSVIVSSLPPRSTW